jgi:hypothetical protein
MKHEWKARQRFDGLADPNVDGKMIVLIGSKFFESHQRPLSLSTPRVDAFSTRMTLAQLLKEKAGTAGPIPFGAVPSVTLTTTAEDLHHRSLDSRVAPTFLSVREETGMSVPPNR